MKKINYFSIYEDFFKDANNFLNTIETKNNFFDYSSESSADNKNERNDCTNNKNGEYADFYINVESNKVTFKSDLLENEKKKNNNNYTNIKFSSRILLCYKNTHSLCLSYKPYNENTCNDSSNVNNSISILKKKNSNFDDKGEEYNLKKKNENKILNFLYKWILPLKKDDANVLKETKKKIKNKDIITKKVDDERNIHSDKKKKKFYNLNNNNLNITTKKTEENIKKDQNINEIKKRKKGKKGISYEHLLKPSRYDYDAFCLFNPRFKQGKHHTVMYLQSYNVSIIPFVKPKKLKEKVNELFSEINPWIHKSLTLSKLRNLKIDLFNLINFIPEIDISTISCAWVFFERLVIKGYVHKFNRKLYAATCLILSLKFYQHDDIQILEKLLSYIQKLDKKENLTPSLIFSVEFLVYRLLDFSLQHTYENIRPHIHQYLESKELKFEDVYGISEDAYLCSNYAKSNYKFLNSDEINNLEYIFNKLKKNKNDNVSVQNLQKFLINSHNKDICDDLLDFFHSYGGTISLDDFLSALNCDMNEFKSKEKIKSLFEMLDANKKGYISFKNFVQSAKEFENEFDEETLKKIFNIIDLNNNDKILYEEFKNSISNI